MSQESTTEAQGAASSESRCSTLPKCPTGIPGLDELTYGGLPAGRPTLLCGAPGCGKTLFAMTFLFNGAMRHGEPGVFMSFEEQADDLAVNVASLGYDLPALVANGLLCIDHVRVERAEIEESGEYDLEGLFVRLDLAIRSVGARRVVLDTVEALFSGLSDALMLRSELRRLLAWLKARGVTAVITGERGNESLTRHGIEEFVSDCVILLDHRVKDEVTTRRLRVLKYRGSTHGTNEYPFLIDGDGITVMPITSAGLAHEVAQDTVATGVSGLDQMLGRGGYYRGSSVLISGLAGCGKSTFGASFIDAACKRGERCLFFAFEESPAQVVRNMRSVGIDLEERLRCGQLRIESARPSLYGFEMHLARMLRDIQEFEPSAVLVDPISALRGGHTEVHSTLVRLVDICKARQITTVFTSLGNALDHHEGTERNVSSLMDTWIALSDQEFNGERNRVLYVLKARGMHHSNQLREYRITDQGISMLDPYLGPGGVLLGSSRLAQEVRDREAEFERQQQFDQKVREIQRKRAVLERQIAEMRAGLESEEAEIRSLIDQEQARSDSRGVDRIAMAQSRKMRL